jgi:N-acetylmuramate 1-kinase
MTHPAPAHGPQEAQSPSAHPVTWADPAREQAFGHWLQAQCTTHGLQAASLRLASADASFRRYLRIDTTVTAGLPCIVMDAPPDKEDCTPLRAGGRD